MICLKMRKIAYLFIVFFCGLVMLGCRNSNTYSKQLEAEKQLINNYIERNGLNILGSFPDSTYVWGEKDYALIPGYDNLYYHEVSKGDTATAALSRTDEIILRFRKYTLDVQADTINYWTTMDGPNPVAFSIASYSTSNWTDLCACQGVAAALARMKRKNAEAKIICPSKLGTTSDMSYVTPYCYDLKIKGIKK